MYIYIYILYITNLICALIKSNKINYPSLFSSFASVPFNFQLLVSLVQEPCVFAALLLPSFASLLPFVTLLSLVFSLSFALSSTVCISNETLD